MRQRQMAYGLWRMAGPFSLLLSLLGAGSLVLGISRAAALSRELALDEMIDVADEIVVGHVTKTEARWQGKLIVTASTVHVDESLKGAGTGDTEITQLGGTAVHPRIGAPVTMNVSEQVMFHTGEEVLLFVHKTTSGARQLVGGPQGKFVVREEPTTNTKDIPVGPKRLQLLRHDGQQLVTSEVMTLDAMRDRIRAHLDRETRPGGTRP